MANRGNWRLTIASRLDVLRQHHIKKGITTFVLIYGVGAGSMRAWIRKPGIRKAPETGADGSQGS
jgi:hypothetical protein